MMQNFSQHRSGGCSRVLLALCITAMALVSVVVTQPMFAQTVGTGSIEGTVLDQQGHVIPNAQVTATDPATGRTVTQKSSSAGVYVLTQLPPATYSVEFKAVGFAAFNQENVVVDALAVVGLSPTLKVGTAIQEVTVSSAPPELQTENGTLDTTIPNDTYTALPVSMGGSPKSPLGFLSLIPGSTGGDFGVQDINGGPGNSSLLYLNGLPVTTSEMQGDARNVNGSTTTEVVDQFQVVTSGLPAYYSGQGVTNLVLKSGTNSFHGDVYENVRNTVFDAAGFFSAAAPVEHQNEYGFSVGGPFLKNRLFFFFNYDRFKYVAGNQPAELTLPTTAERNGDFSQLLDPTATGLNGPVYIYDPSTDVTNSDGSITRCAIGQTVSGGACSGNATNIIPGGRISTLAKQAQSYLPATINDSLQNNYLNALPSGNKQPTYFGKLDWTITDKHRAYAMFQNGKVFPSSYYNGGPELPLPYTSGRYGFQIITIAQVGETWTIKPSLVNSFSVGFNQFKTPFVNPTGSGGWAAKLGVTGLPNGYPQQAFPQFSFSGPVSPTIWASNGYSESFSETAPNFVYQDNLQWIKGKNSFTFGGQLIAQQENTKIPSTFGGFTFANNETAGIDNVLNSTTGQYTPTLETQNTGHGYASYLLGLVDGASASDTAVPETGARYKNLAFYGQDDYKLSPKLTLNIGLRYVIATPFKEDHNRNSWFNPLQMNPMVGIPGALQFDGYTAIDNCNCESQVKIHWLTFDPRVGFAYSVNKNTVVRGSYTIIHYNGGYLGGNASSQGVSLLGYSAGPSFSSPDGGITPAFDLDGGFPAYTHPPFFDSTLNTGYNTTTGAQAGGVSYNLPDRGGLSPYTENWNLTVSRAVTSSMTLQASYAGSGSRHIGINGGLGKMSDQIDPKYQALGGLLTTSLNATTLAEAQAMFPEIHMPYPTFVGSVGQAIRPYPQYSGIGDNYEPAASSSYNALQLQMQRRMSSGLYFLAAYTWSKDINNTGGTISWIYENPRTAYNLHQERADATGVPHQISLAWEYKLPFGKGERFATSNSVLDAVAGGWKITAVHQYNSPGLLGTFGAPCTVSYAGNCWSDLNPSFTGSARINGKWGSGTTRANGGNTGKPGIDASAFKVPALYTFGTSPRTGAYSLRGTWNLNENATIGKDFKLIERTTLHLQADAFNIFNRVQFGGIDTSITDPRFGTVSNQANSPRNMQFEAYLRF